MGRAESESLPVAVRTAAYVDADGRPTDDPEAAIGGEIVERDAHGRLRRRTRFVLAEPEIRWLPISESAFLLWVLVVLMLVWLAIGVVLYLT
jgi:hypothetical protein